MAKRKHDEVEESEQPGEQPNVPPAKYNRAVLNANQVPALPGPASSILSRALQESQLWLICPAPPFLRML